MTRMVCCMCCLKKRRLVDPIEDVEQEWVYCDDCYDNCSYIYANGDTMYYHEVRDIISKMIGEIREKKNIIHMSKDKAIEFAVKYLKDRKDQWMTPTNIPINVKTPRELNDRLSRVWNIAVEYMLLDIIPYLYGDALD